MKKQQIKALKKLAEMLPESVTLVIESEVKKGVQLTNEEINTLNCELDLDAIYKHKKYSIQEINHLNRLKKAYAKYKEKGLSDYINWLDRNNKRMNELFENLQTKEIDERLLAISKEGGKGFWNSLIKFLFSFYQIFIGKKLRNEKTS